MTHIISITPQLLYKEGGIIVPLYTDEEMRFRETEWLVQSNRTSKWQSWDLNP